MTSIDSPGEAVGMGESPEPADADLVLRTRSGDKTAFGELWFRHYRSGIAVARSVSPALDPDDLVQEAYARIYQSILRGGGPTGSFRAYLFTSIRNAAAGWGRSSREDTVDLLDTIEDPATSDEATDAALDRSLTHCAFRSLPTRWQEVLWYTEIEQMKPAEVAPLLGMKPTAVAQLAFRAREGLREAWIQAHLKSVEDGSDCQWTIERMGAHARENLSRRDRRKVDEHLADCPRCAIVAAEAKEVSSRLALVLLPLALGATGAAAYLANLQGGGVPAVAMAAGPTPVIPSGVGADPSAVVSGTTSGSGGSAAVGTSGSAAGSGSVAGGGSAAGGSAAAGGTAAGGTAAGGTAAGGTAAGGTAAGGTALTGTAAAGGSAIAGGSAAVGGTAGLVGSAAGATAGAVGIGAAATVAGGGVLSGIGAIIGVTTAAAVLVGSAVAASVVAPSAFGLPGPDPAAGAASSQTIVEEASAPAAGAVSTGERGAGGTGGGAELSYPAGMPSPGGASVTLTDAQPTVTLTVTGEPGATAEVLLNGAVADSVVLDASGTATVSVAPTYGQLVSDARIGLRYRSGEWAGTARSVRLSDLADLAQILAAMKPQTNQGGAKGQDADVDAASRRGAGEHTTPGTGGQGTPGTGGQGAGNASTGSGEKSTGNGGANGNGSAGRDGSATDSTDTTRATAPGRSGTAAQADPGIPRNAGTTGENNRTTTGGTGGGNGAATGAGKSASGVPAESDSGAASPGTAGSSANSTGSGARGATSAGNTGTGPAGSSGSAKSGSAAGGTSDPRTPATPGKGKGAPPETPATQVGRGIPIAPVETEEAATPAA
ncbi:sigma-70 family RNA polymerase sigma factor [Microbacterium sp. BK668]|uniref:sigma-70 family RNA polymerase sigma factor n=1 Tax=Microbacterium sp. BK668 TaxID=2512118 RepID=UPI0010D7D2AA|nr:sigma-70 family RNA polymerase sigma factor [Microbacterium sp. BK668]TDN87711.1 RNA polymerase sigma factor (sigma-70 family) [Microbacterium sp. BK668]